MLEEKEREREEQNGQEIENGQYYSTTGADEDDEDENNECSASHCTLRSNDEIPLRPLGDRSSLFAAFTLVPPMLAADDNEEVDKGDDVGELEVCTVRCALEVAEGEVKDATRAVSAAEGTCTTACGGAVGGEAAGAEGLLTGLAAVAMGERGGGCNKVLVAGCCVALVGEYGDTCRTLISVSLDARKCLRPWIALLCSIALSRTARDGDSAMIASTSTPS